MLILLVVVLAVLLVLSRSVASWQHVIVSGQPGDLLYAATFDGAPADGFNGEWSQYPGRNSAQVSAGQLQITIGEIDNGVYSLTTPHFADFDLRVQAQSLAGPVDNGYGVVFRLQNRDNTDLSDDSYYLFLISADGYYRVSRVVAGDERILSTWIPSDSINLGLEAINHLRVVARGAQFQFFINDQPVTLCIPNDPAAQSTIHPLTGECMEGALLDTLVDVTIPNGQVGVSASSTLTGGEGVVAAFDNLLIYAPEDG
jgi:hypothetical protein